MSKLFKILTVAGVIGSFAAAPSASAQLIELDPLQIERLGIETVQLEVPQFYALADMSATVIHAQDKMTNISAPFGGVVSHVHVLPGQPVKKDAPIVTLVSRDYSENLSGLEQAKAEASVAEQAVVRQRSLVEAGVVAQATLEQAEARARSARAMIAEHKRFLSLTGRDVTGAGGYTVRAPVDGQATEIRVSVGEIVAPMTSLALLGDESRLWAQVRVPARLIGQVRMGDRLAFDNGSRGDILSISRTIDPQTRSGAALATLPDRTDYHAGQFIKVRLVQSARADAALTAPTSAIINVYGSDFVFRMTNGGFEAIPVEILSRVAERAAITGALDAKDRVATRGLSELKALALEEMN